MLRARTPTLEEFNRLADLKREETRFQLREEERREESVRRTADDDGIELAATYLNMTQSIEERIAELEEKLDRYDAAVVQALTENEADLRRVREAREQLLLQAHVLPDGRRVFRTEDGMRLFDEHGVEISAEVISANEIRDDTPAWESFQELGAEQDRLLLERRDIIEYQEKLDHVRERVNDTDVTPDELDALEREMDIDVMERISAQLGARPQTPAAASLGRNELFPAASFAPS